MRTLLEHLEKTQTYLVGVSGGRDSVVLLDALVKAGFSNITIVHVNHSLRGAASDADADFVRNLAGDYGCSYYSEKVDVAARMEQQGRGLESVAREVRHEVFARAWECHQAAGVFLGHHADDHTETVLFNLLRGSHGLKGMQQENYLYCGDVEMRLLRPLLDWRRSDIDRYIAENQLSYREDASNQEGFTARNRIRNEVMPLLEEIMQREVVPQINSAVSAQYLLDDFLTTSFDYKTFLDPQGRLFLPALTEAHPAVQERVLMRFLKEAHIPEITRDLVQRSLGLTHPEQPAKLNLPGGKWLRRKEKRLFIQE